MLVNISMMFPEDILKDFQVTERTALYSVLGIATATDKVQRGITQKIYIQELWFLRSAPHLMLVNISMTFREVVLNVFQVTERTALYSVIAIVNFFSSRGITFESPKICQKKWILYTHFDKLS